MSFFANLLFDEDKPDASPPPRPPRKDIPADETHYFTNQTDGSTDNTDNDVYKTVSLITLYNVHCTIISYNRCIVQCTVYSSLIV